MSKLFKGVDDLVGTIALFLYVPAFIFSVLTANIWPLALVLGLTFIFLGFRKIQEERRDSEGWIVLVTGSLLLVTTFGFI